MAFPYQRSSQREPYYLLPLLLPTGLNTSLRLGNSDMDRLTQLQDAIESVRFSGGFFFVSDSISLSEEDVG